VIEHEVNLRVLRLGQALQQLRALVERGVDLAAFPEPGLPAGLLQDQLHHGIVEPADCWPARP
jgi:hypothetical protein